MQFPDYFVLPVDAAVHFGDLPSLYFLPRASVHAGDVVHAQMSVSSTTINAPRRPVRRCYCVQRASCTAFRSATIELVHATRGNLLQLARKLVAPQ